jgi:glycosyltransferase involved in cell wall biosynthesis
MIRVLYFVDRLRRGGIQSLLWDMLRTVDREQIHFDVLTLDDGQHYPLEDSIAQLGVTVYKLHGAWLRRPSDLIHYRHELHRFFAAHHDYSAVHLNSSSKNFWVLRQARKAGIPVRIAHAHNAGFQTGNPLYSLVGNLLKPRLCSEATNLLACSAKAAKWMFGDKQAAKATIITNGIVTDEFRYDDIRQDDCRRELQHSYGVPTDCLLIGNVGRLERQKNQSFLIRIAAELKKHTRNFRILLIGSGSCERELKSLANSLGVEQEVLFLGFREDRNRWYSAMDIFLLPSLYEGLPVTLIEAQAAGLPALVADTITAEAKLSSAVSYMPISTPDAPEQWAARILQLHGSPQHRLSGVALVKQAGFDISTTLTQLYSIYSN